MRTDSFERRWESLLNVLLELSGGTFTAVMHLDSDDSLQALAAVGGEVHPGMVAPREGSYCDEVLRTMQPLEVRDGRRGAWCEGPDVAAGRLAYLGYPIVDPEGRAWGTLCVFDEEARGFEPWLRLVVAQMKELIEGHLQLRWQASQLEQRNAQLSEALGRVRRLEGLIPICANCKDVRNDSGYWVQVEEYFADYAPGQFSHGICPSCVGELYPELV